MLGLLQSSLFRVNDLGLIIIVSLVAKCEVKMSLRRFGGVSSDEFHQISHITIAKEAWQILEITYERTKKVRHQVADVDYSV